MLIMKKTPQKVRHAVDVIMQVGSLRCESKNDMCK